MSHHLGRDDHAEAEERSERFADGRSIPQALIQALSAREADIEKSREPAYCCLPDREHGTVSNDPPEEDSGLREAPPDGTGQASPGSKETVVELRIVREVPRPFAGSFSVLSDQLRASLKPLLDRWEQLFRSLSLNFGRVIPPEVLARLRDSVPPNWQGLEDPDWSAALEIMNGGIPLIWVPRSAIVGSLTKAGNAESRREILDHGRQDIADDCSAVLAEVTAPGLVPLAGLAADAARALRDGHCAAAQALAANVFDTWLRDVIRRGVLFTPERKGKGFYGNIRRQIKPVTDDVRISELKASGALTPVLMALAWFTPGDPIPAQFARHATAHGAGPEQYTDVNAVIAVMLTTSVLRQAQASGW
jgi:hypothetical protein